MSNAVLTKEQIASYMDQCIDDLKLDNSQKLSEFATLIQTLALVTDDSVFLAIPWNIGFYASELARFRALVAFPILGEEDRKRCKDCIKKATREGIEGLKILKKELCGSGKLNFDNIVKAIAKFSKHGYLMYGLRTQFTALPGGRASKEE